MTASLNSPPPIPEEISIDCLESDAGLFEVIHGQVRQKDALCMAAALTSTVLPEGINIDCLESDAGLFEVIHGEIVEKSLSPLSTWIGNRLFLALGPFVDLHKLGMAVEEMSFILDDDRLNQTRPDVAFISANRWPLDQPPPDQGYWRLAPNLAIEVVSPNDRFIDVVDKAEIYLNSNVEEVWLVIPRTRTVMVYRAGNQVTTVRAGQILQTPLIPGWSLDIGKLLPATTSDSLASPN